MSSRASQQSSQGSQYKQPTEQDLQMLISETVLFILSQKANNFPIRRNDIIKNCLGHFGKSYNKVIQQVKVLLKQVSTSNSHCII